MTESESLSGVYSHSGKIGSAAFIIPLGGLVVAFVLAVVYAYIDIYSPIAGYVSLVFVAGFAFGLGWTISKLGYLARCRSCMFLYTVGAICGLFGLYTSWAVFEYALFMRYVEGFNMSLLDVFFSPVAVWDEAKSLNVNGWYTMFGVTPSGTVLWLLWGIEAVAIVAGSAVLAVMAINKGVFCEDCNQWCDQDSDAVRLNLPEDQTTLQELRPDNLDPIAALAHAGFDPAHSLRVDMWKCEKCHATAAIQVKQCAQVSGDDGKMTEKTEDLTPIWLVPCDTLDALKEVPAGT